ncbi:c-type cytochrome biogenesis protein CcmI [Porticoccaceae bacterium]|nr:c-type cytochrome biogenesis protein CcmI [Porticoccaceae bacterium]MDB2344079.1 c-type cytochrome biogenesis protein CcmI [Porticoccaceae bacterium]MDB2663978.1 c-type cytochrome biogenesis protein CcmI [Porticoccaceae bacterium]
MIIWFGLLITVASIFILYPFYGVLKDLPSTSGNNILRQANIDSYREQLRAFDLQLEREEISKVEHQHLRSHAQSLLLANTENSADSATERRNAGLWMTPVLLLFLPLFTFLIYQEVGSSDDQDIADMLRAQVQSNEGGLSQELISALQQRVKKRPDNIVYWAMLAQAAIDKNDIATANRYYAEALLTAPSDSFLLAQYAESLFLVDNSQFTPRVASAVDRAYIADANNATVLGLKGIEAFGAQDLGKAITFWRQAQRNLEVNSVVYQGLQSGIDRAVAMMADNEGKALPVLITIDLSADTSISAQPAQSVFVAVLSADGPPIPLAAIKFPFSHLPKVVKMTDADTLIDGRLLSSASEVRLIARLSATGSATPQPGDWEASSEVFTLSSEGLRTSMVINRLRQ